jgi:hypothetical protein
MEMSRFSNRLAEFAIGPIVFDIGTKETMPGFSNMLIMWF